MIQTIERKQEFGNENRYSIGRLMSPRDESIDLNEAEWNAALEVTRQAWQRDPARNKTLTEPDVPSGPAIRMVRGFGAPGVPASLIRGFSPCTCLIRKERRCEFPAGHSSDHCVWGQFSRKQLRARRLSTRSTTFSGSRNMAQQTEHDELLSAWRALGGNAGGTEGWSTIPLALTGPRRLRAGRHFPGNEEALLVGFTSVHVPAGRPVAPRPRLSGVADRFGGRGRWHALAGVVTPHGGSLDMFTMMALDVIATLNAGSATAEDRLFQLFLARIRAWQDFMRRGTDTTLGPEAEIGLLENWYSCAA